MVELESENPQTLISNRLKAVTLNIQRVRRIGILIPDSNVEEPRADKKKSGREMTGKLTRRTLIKQTL